MSQLSPAQLLYPDLEAELSTTRRTLERFPEGKGDWRPHEKSMTLGRLATHVAELPQLGAMVLETDEMDVAKRPRTQPVTSSAELTSLFDSSVGRLKPAISAASQADLEKTWTLRFGDKVVLSAQKRVLMRTLLMNHLVHHRAQLGVYYRLLGIPVPSMYGPSADEQP